MKERNQAIRACGYDCKECDIIRGPNNPSLAQETVEWVKKQRGIEIRPEDVHCSGCKGDREKHWNPECSILQCCVDRKGLHFCYQCHGFPCDKLSEWAKGSRGYGEALSRLKKMKKTVLEGRELVKVLGSLSRGLLRCPWSQETANVHLSL